jgi:hypothetical protein
MWGGSLQGRWHHAESVAVSLRAGRAPLQASANQSETDFGTRVTLRALCIYSSLRCLTSLFGERTHESVVSGRIEIIFVCCRMKCLIVSAHGDRFDFISTYNASFSVLRKQHQMNGIPKTF